jgi:flagellar biosynthesis protein
LTIKTVLNDSKGIAVALNYEGTSMEAPEVLMLARGVHAKEIVKISKKYCIPIQKNTSLAQKLDKLSPTSQIPEELYQEVAQIFISLNSKKVR